MENDREDNKFQKCQAHTGIFASPLQKMVNSVTSQNMKVLQQLCKELYLCEEIKLTIKLTAQTRHIVASI